MTFPQRSKVIDWIGFVGSTERQAMNGIESVAIFNSPGYHDIGICLSYSLDISGGQFGIRKYISCLRRASRNDRFLPVRMLVKCILLRVTISDVVPFDATRSHTINERLCRGVYYDSGRGNMSAILQINRDGHWFPNFQRQEAHSSTVLRSDVDIGALRP